MKSRKFRNVIGPQIRRQRCAKNWSQEKLAGELQACGMKVNRCSLARIESQAIWVGDFEALIFAEVFHLDVGELYPRFNRKEPLYASISKMLSGQIKMLMAPEEILAAESRRLTASLKEIG